LNPSSLLSLAWFISGNGKGAKNVVILPYKDRLELFSKYIQQLVMGSLGKSKPWMEWWLTKGLLFLETRGDGSAFLRPTIEGRAE